MWVNTRDEGTHSDEAVLELVRAGFVEIVECPETGREVLRVTEAGREAARELDEPS